MILTLVSGGTHIDFCGKDGLLPIHRAAIGGNAKAIKVNNRSIGIWNLYWTLYTVILV